MNILMWLLLVFLATFVVLSVMLGVAFVRLGRELRRLGDDTESLAIRLQRTARTVQVAVPLLSLLRQIGPKLTAKYQDMKKGKGV